MESGRIIGGKYRLRQEIGEGAMGSVWAATHEMLGREVAIKFLLSTAESPEIAAARFVAEAKLAARVKHRFVVDVFDFGITEDGLYYMGQELLEGVSLADSMYEGPAWSLQDLLQFTAQCLSGLEAVHQMGIIHRDLKPENIFVIRAPEGVHPKLLDFGISKQADTSNERTQQQRRSLQRPSLRAGRPRRLTGVGTTIGTPAYMSPEQLCNASTMDGRADLYSLGVILYEWLTGRVPFEDATNPAELYRCISERTAPQLSALRPDLGRELCSVVERALSPDPGQRFANAADMRSEILRILPSQPRVFSIVQKLGLRLESPLAHGLAPRQDLLARAPVGALDTRKRTVDDGPMSIPGLAGPSTKGWLIAAAAGVLGLLLVIGAWSATSTSQARARASKRAFGRTGEEPDPQVAPNMQAAAQQAVAPSEPAPAPELMHGVEIPDTALAGPPSTSAADLAARSSEPSNAGSPKLPRGRHGRAVSLNAAPSPLVDLPETQSEREDSAENAASSPQNSKVVRTLDF